MRPIENTCLRRGRCYNCGSKLCRDHHGSLVCDGCGLIVREYTFMDFDSVLGID